MKRTVSLILILLLLLSLAGCGVAPAATADTRVITDQDGFEVTLPKEINRTIFSEPFVRRIAATAKSTAWRFRQAVRFLWMIYSSIRDMAICSGVMGSSRNHLPVAR